MPAEQSRRKGTSVTVHEHVKVSGPRVPARQTLDMVGQDDLAGRVSVAASELRTEAQHGTAQHRAERRSRAEEERSAVAGGE